MMAVEHAERGVSVMAGGQDDRPPGPVADDDVLDGWIASLTAEQFERVLASFARVPAR